MPRFPFGEYKPDFPGLDNDGVLLAQNVIPGDGCYRPFPALTAYSSALTARCRGGFTARDVTAGAIHLFAGDATKLYHLTGTTPTWDDVSHDTYGADRLWWFCQFGDLVIATNGVDDPVSYTMGSSTDFAALAGTPPIARYVAVIGDFVVFAHVQGSPQRVHWSGFDDAEDYVASATTQSDIQDIVGNEGEITGIVGGRSYGLVFQERAINRMTFVGPPPVFQFDVVSGAPGTRAPGSIAGWKSINFWLGEDGFYMTNGAEALPIGRGKIDRTFLSDLNSQYLDRITASYDPVNSIYLVAYPGSGSSNGDPNRILIWHMPTGRWAIVEQALEFMFPAAQSLGYTLEDLDDVSASLDALGASLDSDAWKGGVTQFSAFNTDHKLGFFTGSNLEAVIETGEIEMTDGMRTLLSGIRPLVDGGSPTISIGGRNIQTESVTYGPDVSMNSAGECPQRSNYRYLRARLKIPAGSSWTKAQGVSISREAVVGQGRR